MIKYLKSYKNHSLGKSIPRAARSRPTTLEEYSLPDPYDKARRGGGGWRLEAGGWSRMKKVKVTV
jgi:hypothetical protein